MTVDGIDVASYQSTAYATAGLAFVVVKATEGTGYLNPRHAAQVATGRAHGLVVGHYHFIRPGNIAAQATYFLQHASPAAGEFLVLDWEDRGVTDNAKDAWLKAVQAKAPRSRVLLYCNRDFWLTRDDTSYCADGLWIADPEAAAGHPRVEHPWTIHQDGIDGGLDHDVANFANATAMRTWALKGTTAPGDRPKFEPFPGEHWFTTGKRSPIVAAMHQRLVAVGCGHYRTHQNLDVIGSGDKTSYEAWQRKYSAAHKKGWTGSAVQWPPGRETWDALQVPNV
jgi:hypothetical protein